MAYSVLVHKKARDYILGRQSKDQKKLKDALSELSHDPLTPRPKADIKKLSGTKGGEDACRLRAGDYRIVYAVKDKNVYVTLAFQRGKDYREL